MAPVPTSTFTGSFVLRRSMATFGAMAPVPISTFTLLDDGRRAMRVARTEFACSDMMCSRWFAVGRGWDNRFHLLPMQAKEPHPFGGQSHSIDAIFFSMRRNATSATGDS